MADLEIDRHGNVIVPSSIRGTFADHSLPLDVRLEKLALLIGSDEWQPFKHLVSAEVLIREASLRLKSHRNVDGTRQAVVDHMAQELSRMRQINEQLQRKIEFLEDASKFLEKSV